MATLKDTAVNQACTISKITNDEVNEQLSSQGFTVGSHIKVVSKLPFNGAITCESNQAKFAIRAKDAADIVVLSE